MCVQLIRLLSRCPRISLLELVYSNSILDLLFEFTLHFFNVMDLAEPLESYHVKDLKEALTREGLALNGIKNDLVIRLRDCYATRNAAAVALAATAVVTAAPPAVIVANLPEPLEQHTVVVLKAALTAEGALTLGGKNILVNRLRNIYSVRSSAKNRRMKFAANSCLLYTSPSPRDS